MKPDEKNRLVLICGACGKMGKTFLQYLSGLPDTKCIGLSRKTGKAEGALKKVNLSNSHETERFIAGLALENYREIYLIHAIGPFLFEETGKPLLDADHDGIDDYIFAANFSNFQNIAEPLLKRVNCLPANKKITATLCAFGSISDRYLVPWWQSYSKSKNRLREYMREQVGNHVRGVFINVGSTEKKGERPFANKKYWLSCKHVVTSSIRPLLDSNLYWQEIDIFKPNPNFYKGFFLDHSRLKERWLFEMGKKQRQADQFLKPTQANPPIPFKK